MSYFSASQGRTIRIVTVIISGLLVAAALYGGHKFINGERYGAYIFLVCLLTLVIAYLLSVKGYGIDGNSLIIRRPFYSTRIKVSLPVSVEAIEDLPASIRVFGIGGLFSAVGIYYSTKLGWFRSYVSDTKKLILVRSANHKYVLSPNNSNEFIKEFEKTLARAS